MQASQQDAKLSVLIPRERIAARVAELAEQIIRDFRGERVLLLAVLQGGRTFANDLRSHLHPALPVELDHVAISSYGASTDSSRAPQLVKDHAGSIAGRNVLVVEDILDSGHTLSFLRHLLSQRHPRTLKTAAFLDKPSRRQHPFTADYVGFSIPDQFVVGYGMDFNQQYRELPDICVLDPEKP